MVEITTNYLAYLISVYIYPMDSLYRRVSSSDLHDDQAQVANIANWPLISSIWWSGTDG